MAEISIQNDDKKVVFQLFCGRWESANCIDHPGEELKRLTDTYSDFGTHLVQSLSMKNAG
jgi:hypothetical protein